MTGDDGWIFYSLAVIWGLLVIMTITWGVIDIWRLVARWRKRKEAARYRRFRRFKRIERIERIRRGNE